MNNRVRKKKKIYETDPPDQSLKKFITLETYSTAVLDEDKTDPVIVNGDDPISVNFLRYDPKGKHKQLVTFTGDVISAGVKLVLNGQETGLIDFETVTQDSLTAEMEAIVGTDNIYVSVWPGRWLFEFENDPADVIGVDHEGIPDFKPADKEGTLITDWKDARTKGKVYVPFPMYGGFDQFNNVVLDAIAGGTFGLAGLSHGLGHIATSFECREYNDAGNPDL